MKEDKLSNLNVEKMYAVFSYDYEKKENIKLEFVAGSLDAVFDKMTNAGRAHHDFCIPFEKNSSMGHDVVISNAEELKNNYYDNILVANVYDHSKSDLMALLECNDGVEKDYYVISEVDCFFDKAKAAEEEYSVVVKIGLTEYVIEDELSELSEAYEAFDDFMSDNDNGDFNKQNLDDGGEILIKRGNEVIKREYVYAYYIIASDCDMDGQLDTYKGSYMSKTKAIDVANDLAKDYDIAREGYKGICVSQYGREVYFAEVKND